MAVRTVRRPGPMKRGFWFCLALLLLVPSASAHALPRERFPSAGEHLDEAPASVWADFSEPVDARSTRLWIFNETEARVSDEGTRVTNRSHAETRTSQPLPTGGYVVEWETYSAVDGHRSRGAWAFAVGDGPVPQVGFPADPPLPLASVASRALAFLGLAASVGTIAFRILVVRYDRPSSRDPALAGLLRLATILQAAGLAGMLFAQAASSGRGLLAYATDTSFGRGLLLRLALSIGLLAWAIAGPRVTARREDAVGASLVLATLAVYATFSHTAAAIPGGLGALLDAGHVAAVMVWSGGLACLLVAIRNESAADVGPKSRNVRIMRDFSRIAATCIALLTTSGLLMMLVLVGPNLGAWATTLDNPYGVVLLTKILLALLMMGLGFANHFAYVARFGRGQDLDRVGLFRANLRREAINGAVLLILAAILTNLSPA